jgi:transcriptional regulator with XRE-family HTH domain
MSVLFCNFAAENKTTMNNLRVKEILKQQGHTQRWLAEQMRITPIALNKILKRDRPTFDNLEALASALGVAIPELFADYSSTSTLVCPHCGKVITIKTSDD